MTSRLLPPFPQWLRFLEFLSCEPCHQRGAYLSNLSASETEATLGWRSGIYRVLVETVLVVGSILLALALDEWNENREFQDLAGRSLVNFEREIQQNCLRLEDVTLFHVGLRDVLANMDASGEPAPATTIRNIMEGF